VRPFNDITVHTPFKVLRPLYILQTNCEVQHDYKVSEGNKQGFFSKINISIMNNLYFVAIKCVSTVWFSPLCFWVPKLIVLPAL